MRILSAGEIQEWLEDHDIWTVEDDCLRAQFTFKDFSQAMAFIVQVGMVAEKLNHHPRIENTYNKVIISTITHDAGNKITDRDTKLADSIESINM